MDNDIKLFVKLNHWYKSALMRTLRLLVIGLLLFLLISELLQSSVTPSLLILLNFFIMIEIFFRYKVSQYIPSVFLDKNDKKDIFQSFTMLALDGFINQSTAARIIDSLLKYESIKNFLYKADIQKEELKIIDIDKEKLAQHAFETAHVLYGKFVTTIDVFIAYLFLTENETKLLFEKKLKQNEVLEMGLWIRRDFSQEEQPKQFRAKFYGGGIGEGMVTGWTPETQKYADNFTYYALREEPFILGREKEFRAMLEGLVRVQNNNTLLVGDIGSGKENLVRALAYDSFSGNLGGFLDHKRIFELLVGPLTAGVENRGDLETRLQSIVAELSHANNVILYVPEFQNIVGASSYNLDLSGALLPYLRAGNMPVIATMTTGTYKTYMEHNPLKEVFNIVMLSEPDKRTATHMVLTQAKNIEKKYYVIVSFRAIEKAVELSGRFLQDTALPGSAISLLETVANTVSLSADKPFDKTKRKMLREEHVIKKIEENAHVTIATPQGEERDLLLHLEDKLHEAIIGQTDAIDAIAEAMRRVRSGMQTSNRPVSFLFLGPTGVGKTETAKALSNLYYGGEKKMIRLDMSEYTDESGVERLLGLTDKIHDNPSALVLLDEFEKAHPEIHNLFLQVFDDGRLTDSKGVTVSFSNSIIIATSNAGSEFIREEIDKGVKVDKAFHQRLLDYLQTKAIFKPELLNRFDEVITFKPLGDAEVGEIIKLLLKSLEKNLLEQDIKLVVKDEVYAKIAKEGVDRDFGARPLRRFIQDNLEDMIAQKKLQGELTRGKTATFSLDSAGNLQLVVS